MHYTSLHSLVKIHTNLIASVITSYISRGLLTKQTAAIYLKKVSQRFNDACYKPDFKMSNKVDPITFVIAQVDEICRGLTIEEHFWVGERLVGKYINAKSFQLKDKEDLLQFIFEEILKRSIIELYQGNAQFSTYLWTCVVNLLNERFRAEKRKRKRELQVELRNFEYVADKKVYSVNPLSEIAQRKEMLNTLDALVRLVPALDVWKRRRLAFCLLIDARVILKKEDVLFFWKNCPPILVNKILVRFQYDYQEMPDKKVWRILTDFLNEFEGKSNHPDAIRMWVKRMKKKLKYAL